MLQALGNNLLVKPVIKEVEQKKVVIITGPAKKPEFYDVLSVGDGISNIAVGDHVRIFEYGIKEIGEDENKIYIVPIENVYAKRI